MVLNDVFTGEAEKSIRLKPIRLNSRFIIDKWFPKEMDAYSSAVPVSHKMYYHKVSWALQTARFVFWVIFDLISVAVWFRTNCPFHQACHIYTGSIIWLSLFLATTRRIWINKPCKSGSIWRYNEQQSQIVGGLWGTLHTVVICIDHTFYWLIQSIQRSPTWAQHRNQWHAY